MLQVRRENGEGRVLRTRRPQGGPGGDRMGPYDPKKRDEVEDADDDGESGRGRAGPGLPLGK